MEPSQGIQQKIVLTCKPNDVKIYTVGFLFFNGKTENVKPEKSHQEVEQDNFK